MLTTEEAGGQLGVTSTRVRAMIAAGRLPAQKFGPVYMILESDLHLVENRKTGRPTMVKPAETPKVNKKRGKK